MQAYEIAPRFAVDEDSLAKALDIIISATENCSDEDLVTLRDSGYIPNGVLDFIRACRVKL